jgi:predicted DNA binding CopG/RHH family protein
LAVFGGNTEVAKIPAFQNLEEAARFWDTHDFEDYADDTESVEFQVRFTPAQRGLRIKIGPDLYEEIKALAARQGQPMDQMVAAWLQEMVARQTAAPATA